MTLTADDLTSRLQLDFKPEDLGDTGNAFDQRLAYTVSNALARAALTPPATDAQIEAGARYHLIAAQIRQLTRKSEEFEAVGELKLKEGLAARLPSLRTDLQWELTASGLAPARERPSSVSVPVVSSF